MLPSRLGGLAAVLLAVWTGPLRAQGAATPSDTARSAASDSGRVDSATAPAPAVPPAAPVSSAAAAPVTPSSDQARGVDAEIRVALFELMGERPIPALSRLQWLQASPTALTAAAAPGALRGREDLLFLLAESYYRLGVDSSFRSAAQALVGGRAASRYAPILRAQLLLDAYRHGEYARVVQMSKELGRTELRGLAALVAGLASYQAGAVADARASFAAAVQSGAPYAAYAQYMDALAQLRADTSQTGAALASLQSLAASAGGEFADQVRLTAAQLAYESGQYDQAVTLSNAIAPTGGLAAQALLTRAWALYKSKQIGPAGDAFAEFATRYPQLPERDEGRLMSAQALLQLGRTDEAARIFNAVAASAAAEADALQAGARGAMGEAARALVAARAAGLLFLADPSSGKTVALQDAAGADPSALAAAVTDSTAELPAVGAPDVLSLDDLSARFGSVGPALGGSFPQRILFTQTSATTNRTQYGQRAQALYNADVAVALARHRLDERMAALASEAATLNALQQMASEANANFTAVASRLAAAQDSLARLTTALDAASARIRQLFRVQLDATRALAGENAAMIDSVRTGLAAGVGERETELLTLEAQTAGSYRATADIIERGLDGAVTHHPAFALRDSVRMHGDRARVLLGETERAVSAAQSALEAGLARLRAGHGADAERGALAAAEARRASAEAQVVAVVDRELSARAGEMAAQLRRGGEAAEFGAASAAFFQALDAEQSQGTNGRTGGSASAASGSAAPPPPAALALPQK